jgi:hypothetical protein
MASTGANFTAAINALVAERDRVFLLKVAEDYKLPYEELHAKYLDTAEVAIKVPRKYTKREPKAVAVVTESGAAPAPKVPKAKAEKQCCTSQTAKKEPCKFSALKGEVFCKRHLRQSLEEEAPAKEKTATKKAAKKAPEPMHTHALDGETHEACAPCQSHGNPLNLAESAEFEQVPKAASVASRLAAMLEAADSEAESEAESDAEDLGTFISAPNGDLDEEEFEDDE